MVESTSSSAVAAPKRFSFAIKGFRDIDFQEVLRKTAPKKKKTPTKIPVEKVPTTDADPPPTVAPLPSKLFPQSEQQGLRGLESTIQELERRYGPGANAGFESDDANEAEGVEVGENGEKKEPPKKKARKSNAKIKLTKEEMEWLDAGDGFLDDSEYSTLNKKKTGPSTVESGFFVNRGPIALDGAMEDDDEEAADEAAFVDDNKKKRKGGGNGKEKNVKKAKNEKTTKSTKATKPTKAKNSKPVSKPASNAKRKKDSQNVSKSPKTKKSKLDKSDAKSDPSKSAKSKKCISRKELLDKYGAKDWEPTKESSKELYDRLAIAVKEQQEKESSTMAVFIKTPSATDSTFTKEEIRDRLSKRRLPEHIEVLLLELDKNVRDWPTSCTSDEAYSYFAALTKILEFPTSQLFQHLKRIRACDCYQEKKKEFDELYEVFRASVEERLKEKGSTRKINSYSYELVSKKIRETKSEALMASLSSLISIKDIDEDSVFAKVEKIISESIEHVQGMVHDQCKEESKQMSPTVVDETLAELSIDDTFKEIDPTDACTKKSVKAFRKYFGSILQFMRVWRVHLTIKSDYDEQINKLLLTLFQLLSWVADEKLRPEPEVVLYSFFWDVKCKDELVKLYTLRTSLHDEYTKYMKILNAYNKKTLNMDEVKVLDEKQDKAKFVKEICAVWPEHISVKPPTIRNTIRVYMQDQEKKAKLDAERATKQEVSDPPESDIPKLKPMRVISKEFDSTSLEYPIHPCKSMQFMPEIPIIAENLKDMTKKKRKKRNVKPEATLPDVKLDEKKAAVNKKNVAANSTVAQEQTNGESSIEEPIVRNLFANNPMEVDEAAEAEPIPLEQETEG